MCEWVIFVFAKVACAPEGRVCLIFLAVCSQFLSYMCQEENVFITEYVGDAQIPGCPPVVWDVCARAHLCVWGAHVCVFIRGVILGCFLLLCSYHFTGYVLTVSQNFELFWFNHIYGTVYHSTDKRKCPGILLWTLKLTLCFCKNNNRIYLGILSRKPFLYVLNVNYFLTMISSSRGHGV